MVYSSCVTPIDDIENYSSATVLSNCPVGLIGVCSSVFREVKYIYCVASIEGGKWVVWLIA